MSQVQSSESSQEKGRGEAGRVQAPPRRRRSLRLRVRAGPAAASALPGGQRREPLCTLLIWTKPSSKERSVSTGGAPGQRDCEEVDESCTQTILGSDGTGSRFHARFLNCRENRNGTLGVRKEKPAAFKPGKNEHGRVLTIVLGDP